MSDTPAWCPFRDLPRAHGAPPARGRLRTEAADFEVDEQLGFAPDGDGGHWLLRVKKIGVNTDWLAHRLAAIAGVPTGAVGYAGLKDRHAVATQWFSVPSVKPQDPDWVGGVSEDFRVIEAHRHRRKLRRGALLGNAFRIRIRAIEGDRAALETRLARLAMLGAPSYFGEQRFGIADGNLARATAYLQGRARAGDRHRRGLLLSAVRGQIFNELLAKRVLRGDWDRPLVGDRMQLAGTRSHFLVEVVDEALIERARGGDVDPTGPLWGRGAPPTSGEPARLELAVGSAFPIWAQGLEAAGLEQERRPLRLRPKDLAWTWPAADQLAVTFALPAGSYATTLLREAVAWDAAP